MRTVFDLRGRFIHKTRTHVHAPIHIKTEFIDLKKALSIKEVCDLGHEGLEALADTLAVPVSVSNPTEKMWLEDWQLIPNKVEDHV